MNKPDLATATRQLKKAGMLLETDDFTSKLESANPVNYFSLPARAATHGRIVVAYAHLDKRGFLDESVKPAYGVIAQPIAEDDQRVSDQINEIAVKRVQQLHAVAEHLAFQRGILTPYGR